MSLVLIQKDISIVKILFFIGVLQIWNVGTALPQEHSQNKHNKILAPSHESAILFVTQLEETIYSLDDNSLLKVQHRSKAASSPTHIETFFIGREKLQRATLHYPFIIAQTKNESIILYSIPERKNMYAFPSDGHSTAISQDNTIFAFTYNANIFITDIQKRNTINTIAFNTENYPIFITFSTNKQNIMIYYLDGTIEYRHISSAKILQQAKSKRPVLSLILNTSRRYIIGYDNAHLVSIDAVNGTTVSDYLFVNTIKDIALSKNKRNVLVLSEGNNRIQTISLYTILANGKLLLNDGVQISGLEHTNTISQTKNNTILIGKKDGSILSYNTKNDVLSPLYSNTTQAIYDASIFKNNLIIAKSDALLVFPLETIIRNTKAGNNAKNSDHVQYRQETYEPALLLQYSNPRFILPHTINTSANDTLYVLSQDPIAPLLYTLNTQMALTNAYALQFIPNLVFIPQKNHIMYYKNEKTFLVSQLNDRESTVILDTNKLMYTRQASDMRNIVWINTPFHTKTNNENVNTELILWGYDIKKTPNFIPHPSRSNSENTISLLEQDKKTITEESTAMLDVLKIELPFNTNEVYYLQAIDIANTSAFFLVTKEKGMPSNTSKDALSFQNQITHTNNILYNIHLISLHDTLQNEKTSLISSILSTIQDDEILHILPYGDKQESIILFAKHYIRIINIDTSSQVLSLDTRMIYPSDFGIIHKVGIYNNYIVMIDTHNTMMILELKNNALHKKSQILLSKQNIYIKEFI